MNTLKLTPNELVMLDELARKGTGIGRGYYNKFEYLKDLIFKLHYEDIEKKRHSARLVF